MRDTEALKKWWAAPIAHNGVFTHYAAGVCRAALIQLSLLTHCTISTNDTPPETDTLWRNRAARICALDHAKDFKTSRANFNEC
jgi:hypothetical protein